MSNYDQPSTSQQLDRALAELAKMDGDWELFVSQRDLTASQRARHLLSNPLFLNLAVVGCLHPRQLLDCDNDQELRDLVLDRYLDRELADQRQYEPTYAHRYLAWIARFLYGDEVSPFGLKTPDSTVFDLANLTPAKPPTGYRISVGLLLGLVSGLLMRLFGVTGLRLRLMELPGGLLIGLVRDLLEGLLGGLLIGLVWELLGRWSSTRSALSSRLTFRWPSTRQRRRAFLRKAGQGLFVGLVSVGLVTVLVFGQLAFAGGSQERRAVSDVPVSEVVVFVLVFGLLLGLGLVLRSSKRV